MLPRLKDLIVKEIQPNLKEKFGYKNLYMGPQISKVVINMGLGLDGNDAKILKSCEEDLANITGQKPVTTKFKKSIANFKTIEIKGLEFNPFNKKWKKSDNLSVNYIICSSKI